MNERAREIESNIYFYNIFLSSLKILLNFGITEYNISILNKGVCVNEPTTDDRYIGNNSHKIIVTRPLGKSVSYLRTQFKLRSNFCNFYLEDISRKR